MTEWTNDKLARIGSAEEIEITSRRGDGTLRKPVTIWVIRHGDGLYVRSVKGRDGAWFRGTQEAHEGRISADGLAEDVNFVDADDSIEAELDAAYRSKYRRYAGRVLNGVLTPAARSTTIKLEPRSTKGSPLPGR
jgi:hypothetical protein